MADRLAAAHAALRADPSIQFTLTRPPPPPKMPEWLETLGRWIEALFRPVGRLLRWIAGLMPDAPYARILLWTLLAAVVAAVIWMVVERIRSGEWRLPRRRRRTVETAVAEDESWRPDAAPARAWLREADRLAAAGRFAEAIHYLLFHSIDDIARRRPQLRRPSLTARELASATLLPVAVRPSFASIAALVERSLFGGRPVDDADWQAARTAYADLALPQSWRS
ncbi:hypothetical protein FHT00_000746 [Sphingomonas insulae]|uniref:Protein-glutamine gamma-glutamyltransferase-like C-terminal domain-containing protein n=1 Tax=Sphingomonas insulae TaxID=424800 RepID=A0ABN1HZ00_9SPHN|nr:DUF4129 domain-containing protein [Sphingomonas insulae]NIJ28818.1 hypothetical protein [Sphingomonas insulae]